MELDENVCQDEVFHLAGDELSEKLSTNLGVVPFVVSQLDCGT